jgi:hypothetical protein
MSAIPGYRVGEADGERWNNKAADGLGFLEKHWWCHVRTLRQYLGIFLLPHFPTAGRATAHTGRIAADAID